MPQTKKPRSPLLPIFLIVVVDVLGLTIILPLLPFYAEKLGATPSVVGLLVSSYAFCQLIAGPLLGRISDTVGRRPLLLVSQIGTLIGFFILAFATSLWMVFLSRIVDGLTAGNLSLAQAYISDVTEPKNRAKAFGIIGIAFGIGFLIGPAFSGFLAGYGYQYPIFAAAALSFTSILGTYFLLPSAQAKADEATGANPPPAGRRLSVLDWKTYYKYFQNPKLARLLTQFFLFGFAFAIFTSGFALFAERRYTHHGLPFGPKQVGFVFAYAGFLGIILQGGLIGRLVARFGERKLARTGFLATVIGYAALGFTKKVPELLCTTTVSSYGTGVLRPTLTSEITQAVGRNEQGVVLGLNQSLMSIAQIVAPPISGIMIGHGLLTPWALVGASAALLGLILH